MLMADNYPDYDCHSGNSTSHGVYLLASLGAMQLDYCQGKLSVNNYFWIDLWLYEQINTKLNRSENWNKPEVVVLNYKGDVHLDNQSLKAWERHGQSTSASFKMKRKWECRVSVLFLKACRNKWAWAESLYFWLLPEMLDAYIYILSLLRAAHNWTYRAHYFSVSPYYAEHNKTSWSTY